MEIKYRANTCINFESEHIEVGLEVLDGWSVGDTFLLAKAMVMTALGKSGIDRRKARRLYREYFGEDEDLDDFA